MPLTVTQVKAIKAPGRYGDGQGLYLNVAIGGSKNWVQRIVIDGTRRDLGLGGFPAVTLAKAREKAAENKTAVVDGKDPRMKVQKVVIPTFAECAQRCHEANTPRWRNDKHKSSWLQTLARHAFPVIGDMPIDQAGRADVLTVLEPIWGSKPETARRVKQRMRTVFRWAMAKEFIEQHPITDALDAALPPMPRVKEHYRALHYRDVYIALRTIAESDATLSVKLCFEFAVLTAARSGEARGATWSEIDLEAREWRIPGHRMKKGKEHVVPLSPPAIRILNRALPLRNETGPGVSQRYGQDYKRRDDFEAVAGEWRCGSTPRIQE